MNTKNRKRGSKWERAKDRGEGLTVERFVRAPVFQLRYKNAKSGGGSVSVMLPVQIAYARGIPKDLAGILVTSDLQGVIGQTLLGQAFAGAFDEHAKKHGLPKSEDLGAILAGDFYSAPTGDVRGATGDVRPVWDAFADRFRWVLGVQGNHDRFEEHRSGKPAHYQRENANLLDGEVIERDGIRVGGVGKIMGKPSKEGRRTPLSFEESLLEVMLEEPDIVVLHQGPPGASNRHRGGEPMVGEMLGLPSHPGSLVICGHRHWDHALSEFKSGAQVLNVDARAVVLLPS